MGFKRQLQVAVAKQHFNLLLTRINQPKAMNNICRPSAKEKQEPYGKCNCVGKETSMTDSRNVYQVTNWRTSDGGICMAPTAVVSLKYVAG